MTWLSLPASAISARREQAILLAAAGVALTLAWWLMARAGEPHAWLTLLRPSALVWDLASWGAAVVVWQAMMIATMLPALMPWILTLAALGPEQGWSEGVGSSWRNHGSIGRVTTFVAGYFSVWLAYSVVAAGIQAMLLSSGAGLGHRPELMGSGGAPSVIGGAVLVVAGVFQFSAVKRSCLTHCRSPLAFFLARWNDGPMSGFRLGLAHGAYCVGCCWALMALGFALGAMNLLWMAALALVVAAEQLLPGGERFGRWVGVPLMVWGARLVMG